MTTLTVELPDEEMQALERAAQQRGISVNALLAKLATSFAASENAPDDYDVTQDPIFNIKAHDTSAPTDLSQNVDHYLSTAENRTPGQRRKRSLQGYGKFANHGPTIEQRLQWKEEEIAREDRRSR